MNKFLRLRWVAKTYVFFRYWYLRIKYPGSAVYDVRDPRSHVAAEKLKAPRVTLKKFYDNFDATMQDVMDQGQEPACTAIGTTLMKRIQDAWEHGRLIKHSWDWLWDRQGRPQGGDYLHRSLQVSVKNPFQTEGSLWPWTGYAQVRWTGDDSPETIKTMKKWLARKHPIKTGFSIKKGTFYTEKGKFTSNMARAEYTGVLWLDQGKTKNGHDSTICGYDDDGILCGTPGFIIYTCWGVWGLWKSGKMILPYSQVKYLYGCHIGHDAVDLK